MKQLLIMSSSAAFNTTFDGTIKDKGNIDLYYPDDPANSAVSAPLTKNPILMYHRGLNCPAASIEIDKDTLQVTLAEYDKRKAIILNGADPATGEPSEVTSNTAFKAVVDFSSVTPAAGFNYTLVLVKRGVVFNERSNWTATTFIPMGRTMTAAQLCKDLAMQFKNMAEFDNFNLEVTYEKDATSFTIEGDTEGFENYTIKAGDELAAVDGLITLTEPAHLLLDKGYIRNLASQCAADRGFEYTYHDGDSIYPGYPEELDSDKYDLVTLRFAVGRAGGKQLDERVTQLVHIAVPAGQGATIAGNFVETDKIITAE